VKIRKWTGIIGDGENSTYSIFHGLHTMDVVIAVFNAKTGGSVLYSSVWRLDHNKLDIEFPYPLAANSIRVVVIG
jgi:hypothetical protein